MNNNNNNHTNLTKPVSIENAINMYFEYVKELEQEKISIVSAFNSELLRVTNKRNISTIDEIESNDLVVLVTNLGSKYGNDWIYFPKLLTQCMFDKFVESQIINAENNPAEFLDKVFPNNPITIIYDCQTA